MTILWRGTCAPRRARLGGGHGDHGKRRCARRRSAVARVVAARARTTRCRRSHFRLQFLRLMVGALSLGATRTRAHHHSQRLASPRRTATCAASPHRRRIRGSSRPSMVSPTSKHLVLPHGTASPMVHHHSDSARNGAAKQRSSEAAEQPGKQQSSGAADHAELGGDVCFAKYFPKFALSAMREKFPEI